MPAATTTIPNGAMSVTINGADHSCQFTGGEITPPAPGEPTVTPISCGPTDAVSEPGDPQPGLFTAEVFGDPGPGGITTALYDAAVTGEDLAVEIVYWVDDSTSWTWTCQATARPFKLPFQPRKLFKHQVELSLTTAVRTVGGA